MPEREQPPEFNEYAAEAILNAEPSDIHHNRFGDGRRLTTPTNRQLDIYDQAIGMSGPGLQILVKRESLTPIYTANSVGFAGTVEDSPVALKLRDTGDVVFAYQTGQAAPAGEEEQPPDTTPQATPPARHRLPSSSEPATPAGNPDATLRATTEPATETEQPRGTITGYLYREPQIFQKDGRDRVRLIVAWHTTGTDGQDVLTTMPVYERYAKLSAFKSLTCEDACGKRGFRIILYANNWEGSNLGERTAALSRDGKLTKRMRVEVEGYLNRPAAAADGTQGETTMAAMSIKRLSPPKRRQGKQ